MQIRNFIEELKEALELEDIEMTEATNLKDLEEYDSLAVLSIIVLIDEKFREKLTDHQLASITTVQSLIDLIGIEHFEK